MAIITKSTSPFPQRFVGAFVHMNTQNRDSFLRVNGKLHNRYLNVIFSAIVKSFKQKYLGMGY